jgi:ABC-2 type transport system permease protein
VTAAFAAEWLKLRRSRLPWVTALAATVGTAVGGLFMFISLNPDRARSLGLLGVKAQLATLTPDWNGHLGLLAQIVAVGGVLIFGVTTLWIFGREFADHTAKDLLALPTSRTAIVAAKYATAALWCALLTIYIAGLGLVIGLALGLPGWTSSVAAAGLTRIAVTGLLTIALVASFGLAACLGRGYLAGVGALFGAMFTAQIVAALGYGAWYPYSVPPLYAGIAGPGQGPPGLFGYATVAGVAVVSVAATAYWWRHTDHTQ